MRSLDVKKRSVISKIAPKLSKRVLSETKHPRVGRAVLGGFGILLLVGTFLAVWVLPEAKLTLSVRSEPVTRDLEIKVDANRAEASSEELVVSGKFVDREIVGSKAGAATGSKNVGKTASGFVSIYNFSKTTLVLKAATTVLTINGKKYFFTQDVGGIRPTAKIGLEDQEVDQTSLIPPVPLVAAGPGEEYNLPKGARLEIENEVFGKQPKALYAIAADGITGGSTREIKVVTQNDIDNAFTALSQILIGKARIELMEKNPKIKLQDNSVNTEVLEKQTAAVPGNEQAEFDVHMKVKIRALVYDESEVQKIISERISRLLPEGRALKPDAQRLTSHFSSVDLPHGQGVLSNHFEGDIIYHVDKNELVEKIRGKTVEEIRDILLSRPEIDQVEISLTPFWVKKVPSLRSRIDITLHNAS